MDCLWFGNRFLALVLKRAELEVPAVPPIYTTALGLHQITAVALLAFDDLANEVPLLRDGMLDSDHVSH